MDWTGGVRRRYVRGKGRSVLQKQKAYFAKARAALQQPRSSQHTPRSSYEPHADRASRKSGRHENPNVPGRTPSSNRHAYPQHSQCQPSTTSPAPRDQGEQSEQHVADDSAQNLISISSNKYSTSNLFSERSNNARAGYEPAPLDEEEQLLLAHRRRLLARNNWLGITAKKPANIRSSSNISQDRIGRRRKIRSTSTARQRPRAKLQSITPGHAAPFFARDEPVRAVLRPEDISIQIGTDALRSHTQIAPTVSPLPDSLALRAMSTGPISLSEESMLFGPEFEAQYYADHSWDEESQSNQNPDVAGSLACVAGSQIANEASILADELRSEVAAHDPSPLQQQDHDVSHDGLPDAKGVNPAGLVSQHDERTSSLLEHNRPHSDNEMLNGAIEEHSEVDLYDLQKRILALGQSHIPLVDAEPPLAVIPASPVTPSILADHLTDQPAKSGLREHAADKAEEAWRHFIIGSEASSPEPQLADIGTHDHSDEGILLLEPSSNSSAFGISGLGTSVRSTKGAAHSTFSNMSQQRSSDMSRDLQDDISEVGGTSMLCYAGTVIQDQSAVNSGSYSFNRQRDRPEHGERGIGKNHAASPKVLNPHRFRRSEGQLVESARKSNRFKPCKQLKAIAAASVHEDVDEHGPL